MFYYVNSYNRFNRYDSAKINKIFNNYLFLQLILYFCILFYKQTGLV